MSVGLTAAAFTATRTSPGPASRTGRSTTRSTSRPPGAVTAIARIVLSSSSTILPAAEPGSLEGAPEPLVHSERLLLLLGRTGFPAPTPCRSAPVLLRSRAADGQQTWEIIGVERCGRCGLLEALAGTNAAITTEWW